MNTAQASRIVVICAFIEAAFILARARRGTAHDATVKSLWAIGVVTLGLSMVADFAPQVAGPFAVLMLAALAARSRGELGEVLGVSPASSSSSPPAATTAAPGMTGPQGTPGGPLAPGLTGPVG